MDITIKVSEKTERRIMRQAQRTGTDVDKVISDLVEEVWDEHFPEPDGDVNDRIDLENPFKPFIGMSQVGRPILPVAIRKFCWKT